MTAVPAWPPQSAPRLFVEKQLADGLTVSLEGPQAHYLLHVLRLKPREAVILCDNITGAWAAEAITVGKRGLELRVTAHLAPREDVPDLWLLAAPVKRARFDMMIEKACELGVARIVPVATQRTVIDRINPDRMRAQIVEAAEQCGRTALPEIAPVMKLAAVLADWPEDRALYFADETGGEPFMPTAGPAAILIGPEGGFTPDERNAIRALPAARAVSLGPRILRAETAALTAISIWMAAAGDWRHLEP
jgi:16S rRNA (uracil1498-N3)-methyltransferase